MKPAAVTVRDLAWLEGAVRTWDCTLRWDLYGETPSGRRLKDLLFEGVAFQRRLTTDLDQPAALLQVVDPQFRHGVARLEVVADPVHRSALIGPVGEFVRATFDRFPFRKLRLATAADMLDVTGCLAGIGPQVACFPRDRFRGRAGYVDVVVHELWEDRFT